MPENQFFFRKKIKILLKNIFYCMPKYCEKQIFSLGRFPEVGQKQKTEREKERLDDGDNNGQLRIGMTPRVTHAKPPGPIWAGGLRKRRSGMVLRADATSCFMNS